MTELGCRLFQCEKKSREKRFTKLECTKMIVCVEKLYLLIRNKSLRATNMNAKYLDVKYHHKLSRKMISHLREYYETWNQDHELMNYKWLIDFSITWSIQRLVILKKFKTKVYQTYLVNGLINQECNSLWIDIRRFMFHYYLIFH